MVNKFERIDLENDVISGISEEIFDGCCTFTAEELLQTLKEIFNPREEEIGFFENGVTCKVLKPGKNWQKGKIRITLEFCPDEPKQPTSPLDDIRKQMKETEK
ncbi:KGK domain-containing protein [Floridanema evergladense]|uniref:KGK domain-containing protein n=1 Tax=Floridaenema evergladense BLCC-F167 TaxID=3153639 RepID=A0ABV4WXC7_9CYAN